MSTEATAFTLPPAKSLVWLPPLILQAALLHPCLTRGRHASLARLARQALIPIIAYLALFMPAEKLGTFEPKERCVPLNFAYSVARPWAVMKALEWGSFDEADGYRYVGIVEEDGGGSAGDDAAQMPPMSYSLVDHASTALSLGFRFALPFSDSLSDICY
jgi:hypothetical protein